MTQNNLTQLLPDSNVILSSQSFYFPDKETYDGVKSTTEMATDAYIVGDNPLYHGGIDIVPTEEGSYMVGGAEFNATEAEDSERFEHRYGEVSPENVARYVLSYYKDDRNAIGYNGDSSDYTWWARVEDKTEPHGKYQISIIWSNEVDSLEPYIEKGN